MFDQIIKVYNGFSNFLKPKKPNNTVIRWTATIGLVPGYGHNNDLEQIEQLRDKLVTCWFKAMEETKQVTGFTISAVMMPTVVLYPLGFGCPVGGEQTVTLTGSSSPQDSSDLNLDKFKRAVERTVKQVQQEMEQKTVRIEFDKVLDQVYSKIV